MTFAAAREMLRERHDYIRTFTALFIQQDQPALSLIQELRSRYDVRIPEELSVIGYNNIQLIADLDIPLTTIADPMEQVVRSAANACICQVRKLPEQEIRLRKPELVVRGTVRAAAEGAL